MLRSVQAAGGFATIIAKGERDAGTLLVICCDRNGDQRAYERMPQPDGTRKWALARARDRQDPFAFTEYCQRRQQQDRDLWIVELDIADAEQFAGIAPDLPSQSRNSTHTGA